MKRTVAFILSVMLVLGLSAALISVAADDYTPSPEHPDVTTEPVDTDDVTEPADDDGCFSTISGSILVAIVPAALMFIGRKKED